MAIALWIFGYIISYEETTLAIPPNLANLETQNSDNHITVKEEPITLTKIDNPKDSSNTITIFNGTVTLSSGNAGTITIRVYSVTLKAAGTADNPATIRSLNTVTFTITKSGDVTSGNIEITLTADGRLTDGSNVTKVNLTLKAQATDRNITVTPAEGVTIFSGYAKFTQQGSGQQVKIQSVTLIFSTSNISNISGANTSGQTVKATKQTITGIGCTPNPGYYISGTNASELWNESWDGGKRSCWYWSSSWRVWIV